MKSGDKKVEQTQTAFSFFGKEDAVFLCLKRDERRAHLFLLMRTFEMKKPATVVTGSLPCPKEVLRHDSNTATK